jgi:hypothetical protein
MPRDPPVANEGTLSERQLRALVGRIVNLDGRLFLCGGQGPFVLRRGCPIYLNHYCDRATAWAVRRDCAAFDGQPVRVVGRLRWLASAHFFVPGVRFGIPTSHFYMDRGTRVTARNA